MTGSDARGVTRAPSAHLCGPRVALWLVWGSGRLGFAGALVVAGERRR
ncbi:MAG: hypothetical protein ACYC2Z_01535 [Candidatus Nanopelagicales bacterium]